MTPRHFLYAPARPHTGRRQGLRPHYLSRVSWAHALPDS